MTDRRGTFAHLVALSALSLRGSLFGLAVNSVAIPITLLAVTHGIAPSQGSARFTVLAAGPVLALAGTTLLTLPGVVGRMRSTGQLTFLAALPIDRTALIGALIAVYGLASVPGAVLSAAFAARVAGVGLAWNMWLVVLAPLSFVTLAAIGLLVGLLARDGAATMAGNLAYVAALAAPLAAPSVPHGLFALAPTSLAIHAGADAFHWTGWGDLLPALVLMLVYSTVGLVLVARLWPWRVEARRDLVAGPPSTPAP